MSVLVSNEGFVGLDIPARADLVSQRFVDERKPARHRMHPSALRLSADLGAEALLEDLLLPVERQVVAEFAQNDVEDEPRRGADERAWCRIAA